MWENFRASPVACYEFNGFYVKAEKGCKFIDPGPQTKGYKFLVLEFFTKRQSTKTCFEH